MMKKVLMTMFAMLIAGTVLAQGNGSTSRRQARQERREIRLVDKASQEFVTVEVAGVRFDMVWVAGGNFRQGCDVRMWNMGKADEIPMHEVSMDGFFLGRYEVTQRLYEAVMGNNPSLHQCADLPVEQVSYYDAMQFIERLNELTGMRFRLPTESEWEYAARGGRRSRSFRYSGGNNPMDVAWTQLNSQDSTHIVGGLVPNELGIYDMTGNVWEWCDDWYDEDAYLRRVVRYYDPTVGISDRAELFQWLTTYYPMWQTELDCEIENPRGPSSGEYKVGRGGSWTDNVENLRLAYRNFWTPDTRISILGLRLALDADGVAALEDKVKTDRADYLRTHEGSLNGLFSVAPDKRVRFSKGNLQYNAVADKYRFAEHQYDVVGYDNYYMGKDYGGWIDLFAWGTSGYCDKSPCYASMDNATYGNGKDKNIDHTSYDWGVYNSISNGGDVAGRWRTLSVAEMAYLFMGRPNAQYLFCYAKIGEQQGLMLLPDDWLSSHDTVSGDCIHLYTPTEWNVMERAGAVFLPAAGYAKLKNYYAGRQLTHEKQVPGINTGYNTMPFTNEAVSQMAKTAGTKSVPGGLYSFMGGEDAYWIYDGTEADRVFNEQVSFRPALEAEEQLGYYWTTIHNDKYTAIGLAYIFSRRMGLMPLERMTRLAVRLVADE